MLDYANQKKKNRHHTIIKNTDTNLLSNYDESMGDWVQNKPNDLLWKPQENIAIICTDGAIKKKDLI